MAWRGRLRDLILAGGAFGGASGWAGASLSGGEDAAQDSVFVLGGGCGNANPDPCICGRPEASAMAAMECQGQTACRAQGGSWWSFTVAPDGAVNPSVCILPQDAGIDGPP